MDVEHLDVVLDAKTGPLERGFAKADRLAAQTEERLGRVKLGPRQAAESAAVADRIGSSVGKIGRTAVETNDHLARVKLKAEQAAESAAAGDVIDRKLKQIDHQANETRRSLDRVRLSGGVPGRSGVRVGPFGSGFGRVGLVGAGIGAGALTGPAAGPAALGLLAGIPTLAAGGTGALGTLALAFAGVGKAIGGDKKAFDALGASQQKFVLKIRSLDGWLDRLKQTAGANMFPGLTAGLEAALSPGTVAAIGKAVQQFVTAIGNAGAAWGRYFGSGQFQAIFGPLMTAGAKNLSTLSSAMLSLFDALGVVGRAAIPLVTWLTDLSARGAHLADAWLRAKDASGGLARGMTEAQASLTLVGRLFASLVRVAGALGKALYPISKIAVKELTGGLNKLAEIINRNQALIQRIVGGALSAFVAMIRIAAGILGPLVRLLDAVARKIGGWKQAFELLFALKVASVMSSWASSIGLVRDRTAAASTEVGILRGRLAALSALKVIAVTVAVTEIFQHKKSIIHAADKIPGFKALDAYLYKHDPAAKFLDDLLGVAPSQVNPPKLPMSATGGGAGVHGALAANAARRAKEAAAKAGKAARAAAAKAAAAAGSPFGAAPPFTSNLGPKPPKPTFTPLPPRLATQLANAQAAAASGGLGDLKKLEHVEKAAIAYLNQEHVTGKKLVAVAKERLTVTRELLKTEKQISQQVAARREERILGLGPGGVQITPGAAALRHREHRILAATLQHAGVDPAVTAKKTNEQLIAEMRQLGIDLPKTTLNSLEKVNKVLREKFIPPDVRENIRARLAQIEETLKSSSKKLASNYKPVHSTDVVKGLGLSRLQKLAIESRVSEALAHGGMAPTGGAAAGIPLSTTTTRGDAQMTFGDFNIEIHTDGKNAKQIANEIGPEIRSWLLKHSSRNGGRTRTVH